jgi:hypothetical protein
VQLRQKHGRYVCHAWYKIRRCTPDGSPGSLVAKGNTALCDPGMQMKPNSQQQKHSKKPRNQFKLPCAAVEQSDIHGANPDNDPDACAFIDMESI